MVNWVLILVAGLAIYIVSKLIHFRHIRHRIYAIVIILLVLFLFTSFSGVVKTHDIDLKTAKGAFEAGKVYFLWLGQAFDNVKIITGNVISMNWLPKNSNVSNSAYGSAVYSKDSAETKSKLPSLS